MDTRVWGPDLWPLLHLIAHRYDSNNHIVKSSMPQFLASIPYVLPCIYCRRSFAQYLEELPLNDEILSSCGSLSRWMYDMHNKVNAKLRSQKLLDTPDPPYEEIMKRYESLASGINKSYCSSLNGWKALYAIATVYPIGGMKNIETLRWTGYFTFFSLLPYVIPFPDLKDYMIQYITLKSTPALYHVLYTGRSMLQRWLHGLEAHVANRVQETCASFEERCAQAEQIRAGCGTKRDKIPTCRQGINLPKSLSHSQS